MTVLTVYCNSVDTLDTVDTLHTAHCTLHNAHKVSVIVSRNIKPLQLQLYSPAYLFPNVSQSRSC